jgi:serine/threonine protein kinase
MYMSPEQASDQSTTSQTDLFSLGVVMYELLAGKHPFAAKGLSGLLNNILNKDPQPIREIRPDIPAQVEAVVKRALQKELAKRYQTGAEMAADLSKVLAEPQNPELQISEEEKFSLARGLKFFQDFSDSEVAEVIAASDWARYGTATQIIEQGDAERAFYIIVSGSASVEQDGAAIATLTQGECFGEMGYLSGSERTASVVVSEVMTVMRIDMPFNEWASLPCQLRLNKAFQRILIERLATTSKSLTAKVTAPLPRDSSFEQTMLLQAGAP